MLYNVMPYFTEYKFKAKYATKRDQDEVMEAVMVEEATFAAGNPDYTIVLKPALEAKSKRSCRLTFVKTITMISCLIPAFVTFSIYRGEPLLGR